MDMIKKGRHRVLKCGWLAGSSAGQLAGWLAAILFGKEMSKKKEDGERDEEDVEIGSRFGVDRMVRRWAGVPGPKHLPRSEADSTEMARDSSTGAASSPFGSASAASAPPQTISETRETPVHATCDVLVVGAGPAGLSAALGARRVGADVMILERFGCFGGVITTVGMETLAWYRYEGTQDCEGIGTEMERVAAEMGGTIMGAAGVRTGTGAVEWGACG